LVFITSTLQDYFIEGKMTRNLDDKFKYATKKEKKHKWTLIPEDLKQEFEDLGLKYLPDRIEELKKELELLKEREIIISLQNFTAALYDKVDDLRQRAKRLNAVEHNVLVDIPTVRPKRNRDEENLSTSEPSESARKKQKKDGQIRVGQTEFRQTLLELYQHKCAVTNESLDEILDAAHIIPYSEENSVTEKNAPQNGFVTTKNWHALYDRHLWTISNEYYVLLSKRLRNTSGYIQYHQKKLNLPKSTKNWPNLNCILHHRTIAYKKEEY